MRPLIIGIAGGTGSGKTTLVENLKEQFGADISVLPHDNYYAIHDRTEATLTLAPNKVILVEGILIFENKALRDLMDIKIFVDTDADVRILRRILRDVKERGRTLESVMEQYLTTVKPMHEQFVEPSKRYADVIVPEGGKNLVALMMIVQRIAYHIEHGDVVDEQ